MTGTLCIETHPSEHAMIDRGRQYTPQELIDIISESIVQVTAGLLRAASAVAYADENGIDLSQFEGPTLNILRSISRGKLHPDLAQRYLGETERMAILCRLPMHIQDKIHAGEPLEVCELIDGSASPHVRNVLFDDMSRDQRKLVFNKSGMRTIQQQANELTGARNYKELPADFPGVKIDRRSHRVIVEAGREFTRLELLELAKRICT